MKIQILLLLSMICYWIGCNRIGNNRSSTADQIHLSIEILNVETYCPNDLQVIDNYLVIMNDCYDTVFQIINIPENEIRLFGVKGKGPFELGMNIGSFGQQIESNLLYVDKNNHRAFKLNPEKLWHGDDYFIEAGKIPFDYYTNVFKTETHWIYSDLTGIGMIVIYPIDGRSPNVVPFYPKIKDNLSHPQTRAYMFYHTTTYNHHKNLIVTAMRFFPALTVIDMNGNHLRSIETKSKYELPQFIDGHLAPVNNSLYYYADLESSSEHIYALRADLTKEMLAEGNYSNTTLEVYDWELELKCILYFDQPFYNTSIDFKNGIIYGVIYNPMEISIGKVKIPDNYLMYFSEDDARLN